MIYADSCVLCARTRCVVVRCMGAVPYSTSRDGWISALLFLSHEFICAHARARNGVFNDCA